MRIRFGGTRPIAASFMRPETYSILSGVTMIAIASVAFVAIGVFREEQLTQPQGQSLPPAIEVIALPPKAKSVLIDGVEYVPRDGLSDVERR